MLQIRLNKGSSSEGGIGAKCLPGETVTVACPDHLVLADLPVAKLLGSETSASIVKIVGRRSRRQLAERVHFCVRCDFPIAVYGRLSPCEHAFCLDCARSDSICYLCDERIQKIQSIKMMEGIFICAAPHCLKSFLKKSEFESHIHHSHADLIQLNMKKEAMDESEASGPRLTSTMDTTLRGPTRPPFPSNSNPQSNDRDDKGRRPQHRDQPSFRPLMHPMQPPQLQPTLSEPQPNSQGSTRQEFGHFSDPRREYPQIYPPQPPNFQMMFGQPPYGFPPQFYGTSGPYGMARSNSGQEGGTEQGSVVGFSPGPGGPVNFPEGYSSPWNMGPKNASSEASQGGGLSLSGVPQGTPPPPPPPGPPPPHLMQPNNSYFSGETSNDGKNYGWQPERHGSIGGSQD